MSDPTGDELERFAQAVDERLRQPGRGAEVVGQMGEDPAGLIQQMGEDVQLADAIAFADMVVSLRQWFSDRTDEPWHFELDTSGAVGSGGAGVEWVYLGVHDQAGAFNGLPGTLREIEAHGYSLFTAVGGTFEVRRYIDWAGLYAQLGLILNWRVPMDPDPATRLPQ